MATYVQKETTRKEYLKIRRAVTQKEEKSQAICTRLMRDPVFLAAETVALYYSLPEEVDTAPLFRALLIANKKTAFPKTAEDGSMEFYYARSREDFRKSDVYGFLEPVVRRETQAQPGDFDLIVAPGVCFDRARNRIGFGKGYYDRYLQRCRRDAAKIAICFSSQILPEGTFIETEATDVPLDFIVTENGIVR